jgi:uncharacterized protein (TIGR02757 family)
MNLKQKLDYHYKAFDKSQISPDPIQFLHLFNNEKDIEVTGIIASVFAYGNVKQIIDILNKIILITGNEPYGFIRNFRAKKSESNLRNLRHRFYKEGDIINLFYLLCDVYNEYDILKNLFMMYYDPGEEYLKGALSLFCNHLNNKLAVICKNSNGKNNMKSANVQEGFNAGIKFIFPQPELGSACKRMNLFLRWMVRKDEIDFGIWNEIPASKLLIPVDTHVARICKSLKLTKRKNVSWIMAEEITRSLKEFDPIDPVKYDFAICHIGMRKLKF